VVELDMDGAMTLLPQVVQQVDQEVELARITTRVKCLGGQLLFNQFQADGLLMEILEVVVQIQEESKPVLGVAEQTQLELALQLIE
jgi:3-polyprenyl-4-hydroxybenzoate decarboxylase